MKYRAEWGNYQLFVGWEDDHWTASVRDITKRKWAWQGDVLGAADGKKTAIEIAIRDAQVSANEADEARLTVAWIES